MASSPSDHSALQVLHISAHTVCPESRDRRERGARTIGDLAAGVAGDEHSAGSLGHELLERMASAGAKVERCGDVYRALALILGSREGRGPGWDLVVARLEQVAPDEMEFFSILARTRGAPPVLVYSSGGIAGEVGAALQAGADGEWNEGAAERWLGRLRSAPRSATPGLAGAAKVGKGDGGGDQKDRAGKGLTPPGEASAAPGMAASGDTGDAGSGGAIADLGAGSGTGAAESSGLEQRAADRREQVRSGEEHSTAGEDSGKGESVHRGAARVPWKQYADRPVRRRPPGGDAPSSGEESSEDGARAGSPGEHTPLLSEDELRELIGDDVAALAPRRQGHDEGNGNGSEEEAS